MWRMYVKTHAMPILIQINNNVAEQHKHAMAGRLLTDGSMRAAARMGPTPIFLLMLITHTLKQASGA
jgi:hypothetical protein